MSDRPQCTSALLMEDDKVRVTRFDFEPGAQTGWHTHEMDYVIVTLTDCSLRLEWPDGSIEDSIIGAGQSYSRPKGTQHNVINDGTTTMSFVEVELKKAP